MKRLTSILLALALLPGLSACGGEGAVSEQPAPPPAVSQEQRPVAAPFTLPIFSAFSLHPVLGANRANLTLAPLLYEGLFQVDEHFQAVPVLCQQYQSSPDKLTWTFTVKSGIAFSDGTPLTGQAVADALELARGPDSRYAQRLAQVQRISAQDQTVTIVLSRPNGSLPLLLDIPIALGQGERPPGTGPYALLQEGDGLALVARSGWWRQQSLPLERIALRDTDRSDQLLYAFDAGDISLVDVDLMATNALGYGGNYQAWDYATTDLLYLGFNTASGPCKDARVRGVLSLAIDRNAILQTVYASHGDASPLPVHPDSPLYSQDLAQRLDYAPEVLVSQREALKLDRAQLRLLVNSENASKVAAAQLIAYQLEAAGVSVSVEQLPFDRMTAALDSGSFDLYLGETMLTADLDLSALLSSSGALNYGRWRDGTTDVLLAALSAAGPDDAPKAAADLLSHLGRQMPIAPLLFKSGSVLTQWGRLSGLSPLRGNVFYRFEDWNIS